MWLDTERFVAQRARDEFPPVRDHSVLEMVGAVRNMSWWSTCGLVYLSERGKLFGIVELRLS